MQLACAPASTLARRSPTFVGTNTAITGLHVLGKGGKRGKVALPPLAQTALDQYLVQRGLPSHPRAGIR